MWERVEGFAVPDAHLGRSPGRTAMIIRAPDWRPSPEPTIDRGGQGRRGEGENSARFDGAAHVVSESGRCERERVEM